MRSHYSILLLNQSISRPVGCGNQFGFFSKKKRENLGLECLTVFTLVKCGKVFIFYFFYLVLFYFIFTLYFRVKTESWLSKREREREGERETTISFSIHRL